MQFSCKVTGQNWTMVGTYRVELHNWTIGGISGLRLKSLSEKTEDLTRERLLWWFECWRKWLGSSSLTHSLTHTLSVYLRLKRTHTHTCTHTAVPPPCLSFTHSHWVMHSSILLYLGHWRRPGRRTKANWNAPVSAFLTWCMAHAMQPGPAATLVSLLEHTGPSSKHYSHYRAARKPSLSLLLSLGFFL